MSTTIYHQNAKPLMLIVVSVILKTSFMNVCIIVVMEIALVVPMFVQQVSYLTVPHHLLFVLNAIKDMSSALVQVE
jgi:hypothetical protein